MAIVNDVKSKINNNQITGIQAVDELTFAVQARQARNRQRDNDGQTKEVTAEQQQEEEQELVDVLSVVQDAAEGFMSAETKQTPRLQGASLPICTARLSL